MHYRIVKDCNAIFGQLFTRLAADERIESP